MKCPGVSTHSTSIACWGGVVVLVVGMFQGVHGSEGGLIPEVAIVELPGLAKGARPLEMIRLKAGTFQMGCSEEERGRVGREWPPHEVTLTKTFEMGRCEVTQAQWLAVMGQAPVTGSGEGPDHPVYHALHLRSADRCPMGADDRTYGRLIGFRLVRE